MNGNYALEHLLEPFAPFRTMKGVTDIVVVKPFEIGVECSGEWSWHEAPTLDYATLHSIGVLCAYNTNQDVDAKRSLCDTSLPTGERLNVCIPPTVPDGTVSLSIRVPSLERPTLDYLTTLGLFDAYPTLPQTLRRYVRTKKNIWIVGPTGSGKTTLAAACIEEIPLYERLITIEDTAEWTRIPHRNRVSLLYSKGQQSTGKMAAADLIVTSLRQRPDRVLIQELRDGSAFAYVRGILAAHPGGITTLHANSARGAFDSVKTMVLEHEAGRAISEATINQLLDTHIHLVVHCKREGKTWRVDDIYPENPA